MLYEGGEIDAHLVSLAQMTNSSTTVQLRNAAPLLYSICWQQYFRFMCNIVVINRGEKEIETPRQFLEHFGFEAPKEEYYTTVDMDCCLCQVDIEKALTEHNIPFKTDCGDFYVGQLDEVVGDAD